MRASKGPSLARTRLVVLQKAFQKHSKPLCEHRRRDCDLATQTPLTITLTLAITL